MHPSLTSDVIFWSTIIAISPMFSSVREASLTELNLRGCDISEASVGGQDVPPVQNVPPDILP